MSLTEKLEQVRRNLNVIVTGIEEEKEKIIFEDINNLVKICIDIIEK